MDIAAMSVVHANHQVRSDASLAMMKKVMDTFEGQNEALINMLDSTGVPAPHPTTGMNIDKHI